MTNGVSNTSRYINTVKSEWIGSRDMLLLSDFGFFDDDGLEWIAPKGSLVNGADIPWIAWKTIGSPLVGRYRQATVLHDIYMQNQERGSDAAHKMFYEAMLVSNVTPARAWLMYQAVLHFGPQFEARVQ